MPKLVNKCVNSIIGAQISIGGPSIGAGMLLISTENIWKPQTLGATRCLRTSKRVNDYTAREA